MTIGSLFSGIGGLELGLERAGLGPTVWQVESDPFCRDVLAKHWPDATRFEDVRAVGSPLLRPVDVMCGGFPCQDVSSAGKGAGLAGARSGLWREFSRIVSELRPSFVIVENVASGARRWLPHVRRDLHLLGYRTRAYALSAADVGAPHERARIFVVAHPDGNGQSAITEHGEAPELPRAATSVWNGFSPESFAVRMAHGISAGVDKERRNRSLGNAVVPQCAEVIGRIVAEMMQ